MNQDKTENELIADVRNGDERAFEELFTMYSARVYSLIRRFTKNAEDAEEAFQDCFVTVFRKISSFKGESSFSSWLYRVAANCAFMKLRKARAHQVLQYIEDGHGERRFTEVLTDEGFFERQIEQRSELRATSSLLAKLPQDYKRIYVLRELQRYSTKEVAKELKVSTASVKAKLFRARTMIDNSLEAARLVK